jgi:hypothetical protein
MSRTFWLATVTALAAGVALTLGSCTQVDCGEGTVNRGGICQPDDGTRDNATCGDGTHLGTTGECVPNFPPTMCDPGTTQEVLQDGVIVCQGTSTAGCDSPITCPTPSTGKYTICGRLYDIADGTEIRDVPDDTSHCDPANPTATGPCSLQVQFYDAISFAGGNFNPQPVDEVVLDHCGRFYAKNVSHVQFGFAGVGVDDPLSGSADNYVTGGVALAVVDGTAYPGVKAYAVTHDTDDAWALSAGLSGQTFAEKGVYMTIFQYNDTPVTGVTITGSGGADPSNSYYFTDSTADSWLMPKAAATQNTTGPDGAAMMVNDSGLANHAGTGGGLPSGCEWPSTQGATIPGVVFIQIKDAMKNGSMTDKCPPP